jgi:nanoRNase/pAp phosphatase (c-di-AMP/oligoRNAs hydrolase)
MMNKSEPQGNSDAHAQDLLEFLAKNGQSLSPLLILPHDYPDPDSLGAAFALHFLAQDCCRIESRIAFRGVIGRMENRVMVNILRIPVHRLKPGDLKKYKHVALVDTQPVFENNPFPTHRKATIVIDQHQSGVAPMADLVLVDTDCGATCVILAQALLRQNVKIPAHIATALAYGILSDTLNLYRARRMDIAQTYLKILQDVDLGDLSLIQNPRRAKSFFVTLGCCIRDAIVFGPLIVSHLGVLENPDLVSQMAEFLLTYKPIKWSFCTGRYRGRLHASLRSTKQDGQAGELLRDAFGSPGQAGGHGAIGGGSCRVGSEAPEEVWYENERRIQERLMNRLGISNKSNPPKPFGD